MGQAKVAPFFYAQSFIKYKSKKSEIMDTITIIVFLFVAAICFLFIYGAGKRNKFYDKNVEEQMKKDKDSTNDKIKI